MPKCFGDNRELAILDLKFIKHMATVIIYYP